MNGENGKIIIKRFNELTVGELYELLALREAVFVVEQSCAYQDADGVDYDAVHLFTLDALARCASCCRIYRDEAEKENEQKQEPEKCCWRIGRLIARERGRGCGMRLLRAAVDECARLGADEIRLHAQQYAIGFYEKAGFEVCSNIFLEDGIPHAEMRLELK